MRKSTSPLIGDLERDVGKTVSSLLNFDSILAGLKSVCTLVLHSEGSEDQDHAVKDREAGAYETCSGGATNGGDGETVPTLGEF